MSDIQNAVVSEPQKPREQGIALTNGGLYNLRPKDFGEAEHIAMLLAKSDIVPKELQGKPANVLLVLMHGNEIGLSPSQSLTSIMVINGRPSLWGDAVMGKVKASSVYEASVDEFDEKTQTATFKVKRKGEDWVIRTFSQADAQKAGLWGKQGPWSGYPKRMLFNRARAFALRDAFPDVLKGLRIAEEEQDVIDVTPQPDGSFAMPQRKSEQAATPVAAPEGAVQQNVNSAAVIDKITRKDIGNGVTRTFAYVGDRKLFTDNAELAAALAKWLEAKTPLDFTLEDKKTDGAFNIVEAAVKQ